MPQCSAGDDRAPWYDNVPKWWPVALALFGLIAFGVRADAQISANSKRLDVLEQAYPEIAQRLGRIEAQNEQILQELHDRREAGKG